jgi:hypothetical protein
VKKRAYSNTQTTDLRAAFHDASGKDVEGVVSICTNTLNILYSRSQRMRVVKLLLLKTDEEEQGKRSKHS